MESVKGVPCKECDRMCWLPERHEGEFTCGHCLEIKAAVAHAVEAARIPDNLHEPMEVDFYGDTRHSR